MEALPHCLRSRWLRVTVWGRLVETFGEAVRRLRGPMSQRRLARQAFLDPGHLSRIESGRRPPTAKLAAALDTALGAGGALVALAAAQPMDRTWSFSNDRWRRYDYESLAGMLLAQTPTAADAVRIAHEWLVADPPQVYEMRAGRRIGQSIVARVERRVHQLRQLDDHVGGIDTFHTVTAELAVTAGLLRDASYTEQVGRRLLVAVGELCQIVGWVASDAGHHVDARRLYLAGTRAAHAAGDTVGAANNLSCLSYQVANIGDPREAVTLARSALRGARAAASATTRAMLLERLAWAYARAAELTQAERCLATVEDTLTRRSPADDPLWTYWLSYDEVQIMAGRVWTQLHRPLRAVPVLEQAIAGYGEDTGRETALYQTWLAESLLQAGEVERAAELATRALRLARRAGSVRANQRVTTLWQLMRPHRRVAVVAEFAAEYHETHGPPGSGLGRD